jgi:hypothetical protein
MLMTIYEVQCRYCDTVQLIDSKKHMFRRYDEADSGTFVQCQKEDCGRLFRVIETDLKEIREAERYLNRGR